MTNNTLRGVFHKLFEEEQTRLIEEYKKRDINLKKIEASAIVALRSKKISLTEKEAKKIIAKLRGVDYDE